MQVVRFHLRLPRECGLSGHRWKICTHGTHLESLGKFMLAVALRGDGLEGRGKSGLSPR